MNAQTDRIAHDRTTGRDHHRRPTGKRQWDVRPRGDGRTILGPAKRRRANVERLLPKGVAEPDPCPAPSSASEHDVTNGLIFKAMLKQNSWRCRLWTRAPCGNPACCCSAGRRISHGGAAETGPPRGRRGRKAPRTDDSGRHEQAAGDRQQQVDAEARATGQSWARWYTRASPAFTGDARAEPLSPKD